MIATYIIGILLTCILDILIGDIKFLTLTVDHTILEIDRFRYHVVAIMICHR